MENRYLFNDGKFGTAYTQNDGTAIKEEADESGNRRGSYVYVDPDGRKRTVVYTAGSKHGFKIIEDHLTIDNDDDHPSSIMAAATPITSPVDTFVTDDDAVVTASDKVRRKPETLSLTPHTLPVGYQLQSYFGDIASPETIQFQYETIVPKGKFQPNVRESFAIENSPVSLPQDLSQTVRTDKQDVSSRQLLLLSRSMKAISPVKSSPIAIRQPPDDSLNLSATGNLDRLPDGFTYTFRSPP